MKYVHRECLISWILTKNIHECEVCKFQYNTIETRRPIRQWTLSRLQTVNSALVKIPERHFFPRFHNLKNPKKFDLIKQNWRKN